MPILKLYFLLLIIAWLSGCATAPPEHYQTMRWQERIKKLSHFQNWNMNAVVAVRTYPGNEGGSANMQWHQQNKDYTILLFGSLGLDLIKLSNQQGHILLETANGKKITAPTVEQLLAQQTGWQLPVSNLYYWIRGLPVPYQPAHQQFDQYFHLTQLNQQGWMVTFLRYTTVNHIDLPTKILLENSRIKVKINISQWQ
ncbi:MAG: lolB [Gammaproteobacteria bacterium]|nr:lolB [Gammaproteobacteria bacterium]